MGWPFSTSIPELPLPLHCSNQLQPINNKMKRNLPFLAFMLSILLGCKDPASESGRIEPAAPTGTVESVRTSRNQELNDLSNDLDVKERAIWQKPEMVIALLGDLSDKTVADIGAGTGYFAFRMLPKAKKVIATEIDPELISFMDSVKVRLQPAYQSRFEARLAKPNDPSLQPNETDAVILVNTYGYIENRISYLKRLFPALSPGGKLLIIDFKKTSFNVGPSSQYRVAVRQVERELQEAGFKVEKLDNQSLEYQYIILASRPAINQN